MKLLRKLACLLMGHAPLVERRGEDSVLACERCHRFFEVFVKDLYNGKARRSHQVGLVARPAAADSGDYHLRDAELGAESPRVLVGIATGERLAESLGG